MFDDIFEEFDDILKPATQNKDEPDGVVVMEGTWKTGDAPANTWNTGKPDKGVWDVTDDSKKAWDTI